jgi:hypothetical protein
MARSEAGKPLEFLIVVTAGLTAWNSKVFVRSSRISLHQLSAPPTDGRCNNASDGHRCCKRASSLFIAACNSERDALLTRHLWVWAMSRRVDSIWLVPEATRTARPHGLWVSGTSWSLVAATILPSSSLGSPNAIPLRFGPVARRFAMSQGPCGPFRGFHGLLGNDRECCPGANGVGTPFGISADPIHIQTVRSKARMAISDSVKLTLGPHTKRGRRPM